MRRLLPIALEVGLHALALLGVVVVAATAWTGDMADAVTYAVGAQRWLAGESPYTPMQSQPYPLHLVALGLGYVYPPASLPLMLPLTLGGHGVLRTWAFMGGLAVGLVAAALVREQGRRIALFVFGITMLLPMDVDSGQASPWVAAAVGASYLWTRAGSLAAAAAGTLKIYPLIAVRWWPALMLTAALSLATIGLWDDWLTAWINARPACEGYQPISLTCALGVSWPAYVLAAVLVLGAWGAPSPIGFFILTVAMVVPAPDLFSGFLLVPYLGLLAAIPHLADRQAEPI